MSDFEWFGEVFNFSMFSMFSWLYYLFLISELNTLSDFDVWVLILKLRTSSTRIWATRGPLKYYKMAETCPKIADIGNFRTRFGHF